MAKMISAPEKQIKWIFKFYCFLLLNLVEYEATAESTAKVMKLFW